MPSLSTIRTLNFGMLTMNRLEICENKSASFNIKLLEVSIYVIYILDKGKIYDMCDYGISSTILIY